MAPGDVFIMNDPSTAAYLPDIFVMKPLYHEGDGSRSPAPSAITPMSAAGSPVERLRLHRDLRRRAAHRAHEALRRWQAQRDHHHVPEKNACR
jgi:hypothetical protein